MLEITDLTLGFGGAQPVIDKASLTLCEGQRLLICGEAGSGKTSLLAAAAGLIPRLLPVPSFAGEIVLNGRATSSLSKAELFSTVSFVSQNTEDQLWDVNVEDAIVFALENRAIEKQIIRRRLGDLIDEFQLRSLRGRQVLTLSGGERRRVAMAAAIASYPDILVLDEPTTGLDPASRVRLRSVLQNLSSDVPTQLISEQDPVALARLATGISLLGDGKLSAPIAPELLMSDDQAWVQAGIVPPLRRRKVCAVAEPGRELLSLSGLTSRLTREHGEAVLNGVEFQVRAGEVLALVGRNGAGKTTLFKSILGLSTRQSGSVIIGGENADTWTVAERARRVSYVPQSVRHILFKMSVLDEVLFSMTAGNKASEKTTLTGRAREILERYELNYLAEVNPFALSARQQTLLGLACADAAGGLVTIIDEPLLARDVKGRRMLERFLSSMCSSGRAVMLISHDLEMVDDLATRLLILDNGAIAFDGKPEDGWVSKAFTSLGWEPPRHKQEWTAI